jgi:NADPH:quinone reductase-like Zn-dependent oxidoreductase
MAGCLLRHRHALFVVAQTGGPEVLTYIDKPRPSPGVGEVLIKVTVSGHYPLKDAAQAHRDLQSRKEVGSVMLTP